jgi:hypothetical protein
MGAWRRALLVAATFGFAACARTSVEPAASPAPEPTAHARLDAVAFAPVSSSRQSLVIPLPQASRWSVDDSSTPWLVARDRASASELRARGWSAALRARPGDCERQVRLWRPETPPSTGATIVDRRRLGVPAGYESDLVVGVHRSPTGAVEGYALLFGASIGRCIAVVYTTYALGAGDADAVAQRLAVIVDGSLTQLRLHGIEDRVR